MSVSKSLLKAIESMKAGGISLPTQVVTMTQSTAETLLKEQFGVSFHIIYDEPKFIITSKGDKE